MVGPVLGDELGPLPEGSSDRLGVGKPVVGSVDSLVGAGVGPRVSSSVGASVGSFVGSGVGHRVGRSVGASVGSFVGLGVGPKVGSTVGSRVGFSDGAPATVRVGGGDVSGASVCGVWVCSGVGFAGLAALVGEGDVVGGSIRLELVGGGPPVSTGDGSVRLSAGPDDASGRLAVVGLGPLGPALPGDDPGSSSAAWVVSPGFAATVGDRPGRVSVPGAGPP